MKNETLKAIARATIRPCPDIVPSRVYVRLSDGYEYSAGGCAPWPSRIETRGFVYYDARSNTTYGKRYATERAARFAYAFRACKNAVNFLRQLRTMSEAEQQSQAEYWLKA
jgi:hypothetical protein